MAEEKFKLPGSERTPIRGATVLGPADSHECITVTLEIRRKEEPPPLLSHDQIVTREEFVASYTATENDFLAVREFARDYGLEVTAESAAKRTIMLAGTVAAMSAAFGVTLQNVRVGANVYRQRTGSITFRADLRGIVLGVFGLDNRPQAKPHFRSIAGAIQPRAGAHPLSPAETMGHPIETPAPLETPAPVAPAAPVTPAATPLARICGSVPIVGVLRITAVMGMLVTAGTVAGVALNKDE